MAALYCTRYYCNQSHKRTTPRAFVKKKKSDRIVTARHAKRRGGEKRIVCVTLLRYVRGTVRTKKGKSFSKFVAFHRISPLALLQGYRLLGVGDGRLQMSDATGETAAVPEISQDCRRVASSSRQAKAAHAQAVILCALGVALSWTNAKKEEALRHESRGESLANAVFFVASIMKAFELLLALYFAQKAFRNDEVGSRSGGPPIMMISGAKSTGEDPGIHGAVMSGFGLEAVAIWTTVWNLVFGESLGAIIGRTALAFAVLLFWLLYVDPSVRYFQELLGDPGQRCQVRLCHTEKRQIPARALSSALVTVVVTGPIAVYALESIFIFVGGSTEPAAYILAVLDLVTGFLALPFICSFVARVVPQLWGGEWEGVTGPLWSRI